jgi:hypothetical protein
MLVVQQTILSLLLALACAAVPWLARRLSSWPLLPDSFHHRRMARQQAGTTG